MSIFLPFQNICNIHFDKLYESKFDGLRKHWHLKRHIGCMPSTQQCTATSPSTTTKVPPQWSDWSPFRSAALYGVDRWGPPYFTVSSTGNLTVLPFGDATLHGQEIDLLQVVEIVSRLKSHGGHGLQLPVIIRFADVLKHRVESLHVAFRVAIQQHGYKSRYQGVYPVKCNQDRYVVEDVVKFGYVFGFGLEVGSKPELLLAMSCLCKGNPDAFLICNGTKDFEFISLSLIARELSLNAIIVLEQEGEVDLVIDLSLKLGIRPVIGVRAKLKTEHTGHFGSTSGEKGKFGLTTTQILRVVEKLSDAGMIDCLQLLHFHIGSQIPSTSILSDGVAEGAQIYCELVRLGATNMDVIDIGGGLGIDYDGSKTTNSDSSVGYTLEEYASTVVGVIMSVCDSKSVKNPVICSESGRALVSHHSVLVFEALSTTTQNSIPPSSNLDPLFNKLPEEARQSYLNLLASMSGDKDTCLTYAQELKKWCIHKFREGSMGMEEMASMDKLNELIFSTIGVRDPVRSYQVNLSIFASIPDYWGIGQLFPIIPIHRLGQRPEVRGILSDLTGDSDGKIDKFIGGNSSLPLHESDGGKYYLGMFLGGAYEEVLGGLHNLFGDPSVVQVLHSNGPRNFVVTRVLPGHSCGDVLRAMQYEPELMLQTLLHRADECPRDNEKHKTFVDEVCNVLARSFSNMPYLVSRST